MGSVKAYYEDLLQRAWDGDITARRELVYQRQDPSGLRGVSEVLDAVADYLERGLSVVPQRPGAKSPAVRWKRYQSERADVIDAYEWWYERWPDAGVALVLGPISDLFVMDVDGKAAHKALVKHLGHVPKAPKVKSGSGKPYRYHLFFKHPDMETKAKATPWHRQLEFRGKGGIVVGPPSLHKSGKRYRWAKGRSLEDLPLPDVPDEVLVALTEISARRKVAPSCSLPLPEGENIAFLHSICHATREFLEGHYADGPNWNGRLFKAACDMAGCGYPLERAEPLLLRGAHPWNEAEEQTALGTIRSAYAEHRVPAKSLAPKQRKSMIILKPGEENGTQEDQ